MESELKMLNHELLISKGFNLNKYPEGKYYEFSTKDDGVISKILKDDYNEMTDEVIIQMEENFSNKIMCVDGNVWELNDIEFEEILMEMESE